MRKTVSLSSILLLLCALAFGQSRTITGQVRDEKGDPVPFASVIETGTKNGVTTDANGLFSIKIKGTQLTISGIGHESKTLLAEASLMAIVLPTISNQLSEVIVNTGFGVKRQGKEIGYSTATVTNKELNQAKVINPVTGLIGKVSGLQVQTTNNSVNPSVRVTLRGNRSILGNNEALIIVDGAQVDNYYLSRLNPLDVESIDILKGASASAIYGSNASNGVLVVTTKKGSRGRPKVNFSSTFQSEQISYMPKLQERFGSYGGESFGSFLGIQFPEDPFREYYPFENQSYGPEFNGEMVPLGGPVRIYRADGSFFDSTRMVTYSPIKNVKRNFFDHGKTYQNTVSFSSGDANSLFYFSYQNVDVHGIVPKDKSGRNTIRINGMKQYGRFSIEYNTSYTIEKQDIVGGSYSQNLPIYDVVVNTPAHVDLRTFRNWRTDPFANPNGYFNAYAGNPWWQIDEARDVSQSNNFVGDIRFSLQITNWLEASYTLGFTRNDYSSKSTKAGFEFDAYSQSDPWQASSIPSTLKVIQPSVFDNISFSQRISGDALLTFHENFGDISTRLIVGNSVYKSRSRNIGDGTGNLIVPGIYNIAYLQGEPFVFEGTYEEGLIGVFSDLTIGYRNYLFLHATGRNDWNSKLAESNRSFFYPGADLSFLFTEAIPFLRKSKILSFGKIRAAYSKVGQVSVGAYAINDIIYSSGGFPYGSQAGFTISNSFANPDLKPEFTRELEFGVELGFLKNRINFQATYFHANTTNQTINAQISSATGFTNATVNLGSMKNKGIELDLRLTPMLNIGPVVWNMSANFASYKNKVGQDLGGEIYLGNDVYAIPGNSYPYLKTTDWVRDPEGRIIVDSYTGFPTKAAGLTSIGATVAPYKLGFTTSFTYKSLTFNAVMDARFGAVILNAIGSELDFTGISLNSTRTGRKPFIIPNSVIDDGTNTGKYIPNTNVAVIEANWLFWANTWKDVGINYVNSADYWKIREISISYDFPKRLINKLKVVQQASLTVSGRNLFMFRPKDNIWTDPEFSQFGSSNAVGETGIYETPPTRIFGLTLTIVI